MMTIMPEIFKVALSLSLSGSLLILILCFSQPLLRRYFSQSWQYYIWLIVIARLLLPFTSRDSLINACFNLKQPNAIMPYIENIEPYTAPMPALNGKILTSTTAVPHLTSNLLLPDFLAYLWLLWLGIAMLLLIRKITAYQSFVKYVRAGQRQVEDIELLEQLAKNSAQAGVNRPVELAVNPMLSTPLVIGLRQPTIVMPTIKLPAADFTYTIKHELTHYKRYDMLYKWLVQITVCLHWFNPLVWLMQKEINRACELACDETVIHNLNTAERRAYGDALLRAMEYGGRWQNSANTVNFNENTQLLKERLRAIMRFKKKNQIITIFSLLLAALFVIGAASVGAYTITDLSEQQSEAYEDYDYKYNYLPGQNNDITKGFLEQMYNDDNIAKFAAVIYGLDVENSLINFFAEKAYNDDKINFFAVISQGMNKEQLDSWLERAVNDNKFNFRAMLLKISGHDAELDVLLEAMDRQRLAEYAQLGITQENGQFYYQGQLLRVLLDLHANDYSCVTLQTNPQGTVAIKITRDADENILSFGYMTDTEVDELFSDDFDDFAQKSNTQPSQFNQLKNNIQDNFAFMPADNSNFDVKNLTTEELPDNVIQLMHECNIRKWYLIHADGRQYIWYNGFAWSFAYQPVQTADGWQINIVKFNKKDYGELLLAMPDKVPITVFCDGQKIELKEIYQ